MVVAQQIGGPVHKTTKLPFSLKDSPYSMGKLADVSCKYVVVWWRPGKAATRIKSSCHRSAGAARKALAGAKKYNDSTGAKLMGARRFAVYNVETGKKLKG